jgi:hypothetical protein
LTCSFKHVKKVWIFYTFVFDMLFQACGIPSMGMHLLFLFA